MNRLRILVWFTASVLAFQSLPVENAIAQGDKNKAPINYETTEPEDRVAILKKEIEQGNKSLDWDDKHGWLPAILEELEISSATQTLVFSKTSQQLHRINPSSPRALYFNDDTYLGFVQKGDFLEVAAVDPMQGAIFYTIDQLKSDKPKISRASSQCLSCHESYKTKNVPGFLVRSVYPTSSGHPEFRLGTNHTDHKTQLKDRFGGWYVTGKHGDMRHRGNVIVDESVNGHLNREAGANLEELPSKVRTEAYLEPTSDIVALMILEHQSQFHNYVTAANYTARQALHHQAEMNELFKREAEYRSNTTNRRLESAAEKLVQYLFFCDEFELTSPVEGNSEFAKRFQSKAIRTADGRSLRDLDLKTRLLEYPCSYLVYTESFNRLPESVRSIVIKRILEILKGEDTSKTFQHLSDSDRQNILEILTETHPLFRTDSR